MTTLTPAARTEQDETCSRVHPFKLIAVWIGALLFSCALWAAFVSILAFGVHALLALGSAK